LSRKRFANTVKGKGHEFGNWEDPDVEDHWQASVSLLKNNNNYLVGLSVKNK
jgi:hypothetical protein